MKKLNMVIQKHLAVISKQGKEWEKQLNLVSWNCRDAVYDLRSWNAEDASLIGKGITLTEEELFSLGDVIQKIKEMKQNEKERGG